MMINNNVIICDSDSDSNYISFLLIYNSREAGITEGGPYLLQNCMDVLNNCCIVVSFTIFSWVACFTYGFKIK